MGNDRMRELIQPEYGSTKAAKEAAAALIQANELTKVQLAESRESTKVAQKAAGRSAWAAIIATLAAIVSAIASVVALFRSHP